MGMARRRSKSRKARAQGDEVGAHLADELELLADEVVGLGSGVVCVIGVAVGAAEEEALAVELEGAVFYELGVAYAEALFDLGLAGGVG